MYESSKEYAEAGFSAAVFKCQHLSSQYGVPFVKRLLERENHDFEPIGSIVLNYPSGGFNPILVQSAIDIGAKVLWMPTIDAKNHYETFGGPGQYEAGIKGHGPYGDRTDHFSDGYEGKPGLYALTDDGKLKEDVRLCIEMAVDNDLAIFAGHPSYEEIYAIFEYAADLGHEKMVVDHPTLPITDMGHEEIESLVDLGAYVNWLFVLISPKFQWSTAEEFASHIQKIGVDNSVVSSGMGQIANPTAPEALRILGELLIEQGFSKAEYKKMVRKTPKQLLSI